MDLVLLVLTFIVNFIMNFIFWVVVHGIVDLLVIYNIMDLVFPLNLVPRHDEQGLIILFSVLSTLCILIPAIVFRYGPFQWLLIFSNGGRKAKGENLEKLQKIMDLVCARANLNWESFKLYTYKKDPYNAFALGTNNIVVSEDMLSDFSFEEVCGVVAHEMGHLQKGHTKMLLWAEGMSWFGNIVVSFYSLLYLAGRILCFIPFLGFLIAIVVAAFFVFLQILNFILDIPMFLITRFGSRKDEYAADAYASAIGLGVELACSLQHIDDIMGNKRLSFFERLAADHPDVPYRIKRLGELENKRNASPIE